VVKKVTISTDTVDMEQRAGSNDWLRVRQAAELLGVSPTTVRRWADSGTVAARRTPSGQRRFLRHDLERQLTSSGGPAPGPSRDPLEQRFQLLLDTSLELSSTLELDEVLQSAARRLTATLGIPDCDIYRLEEGDRMVCLASAFYGAYDGSWVGKEIRLADWSLDRAAVETGRAQTASSLDDPRLSESERAAMAPYGQRSQIALPLVARDKVIGVVDLLDHVERDYTPDDIAAAEAVGQLVALAIEHAQLYDEVKRLHLGNLRALSSALSAKDHYTLGHAGRVAAYSAMLAEELGWQDDRVNDLQNVAFLHDIGKIGVSDRVLLKAGPLTSEEWELMRQHPGISAEIVRPLFDTELVAGVRHHHERFDGTGYPDGLAGTYIPIIARAMCVVDCYDAMSCERPYRHALSYRQCLAELRRCAGTQFDSEMVEAFLRALDKLRRRRRWVTRLSAQAAELIDPEMHAIFRTRADELRPEYQATVSALRGFRDAHPPLRFVTSFALVQGQCVTVLDTGEDEDDVSHCGEPWLAEDQLARVLAHEERLANVLTADDFGVWVSGIAPIRDTGGTVVAAVTVDAPAVESFTADTQGDRSHALAAMLQAAAIRFSRAEVEAITDGLTGLYNHRYLHERLEEELRRASLRGTPLSLLFLDCDNFKGFNDTYGHRAGDAALARIARVLESGSRRVDLAARYGGEEFVLVLVETDLAGALKVAGRIRTEVQASATRAGQPLTVSVGVAVFPKDATGKDELLDKADWAMYVAKSNGRNQVLAFADQTVAQETWLSRRGR
jgi:diguanylate cyclase (GGDEF)-like protein/excisionase family DNA binding protein